LLTTGPATPTSPSIAAIPGGYTLNWTASSDPSILSYQVWQASGASQPFSSATLLQTVSAPATSVSITGQPTSALTVFLIAVNAGGSSSPTSGLNVTPLSISFTGTIVVSGSPWLNSGSIVGGSGTISAATQSAQGIAGWINNGTADVPTELAVGSGVSIVVTGTGTAATGTLTATAAPSLFSELVTTGVTANAAVGTLAADLILWGVEFRETAGHAVVLGLGTTSGATDILVGQSLDASSALAVPIDAFNAAWFSNSTTQVVYASSASWGSASVKVNVIYKGTGGGGTGGGFTEAIFAATNLSGLPTADPGGGLPWLNNGFVAVGTPT
jgi:hypothetical protein